MRQLEQENGRLKKMVADRDLEIDVLKEITRKKWWAHACAGSRSRIPDHAVCPTAERAPLGYQSRRAVRDAPALAAMRRLAAQSPRYGYRRIRIVLRREGPVMSPDRAHRLWRHAGLQVPRRRSIWRSRRWRYQPVGGPTRPALPPRAPRRPSASCDAPPRKDARASRHRIAASSPW